MLITRLLSWFSRCSNEQAATVSGVLTVGFVRARHRSGNRTSSIGMGHDAENKSSVISFQLSVTTAGKAIADSGQLISNPQPRAPIPQPFPRYLLSITARAAGPAEAG